MKHVYMIFAASISFSALNAMNAPDVTRWQSKNPEEKQQLVTIYKDFCQDRVNDNVAWMVGSLVPFIFKVNRTDRINRALFGLFALRQTYLLGRNCYRADFADKGNLSYLNRDVLEQLGNPRVHEYSSQAEVLFLEETGICGKSIFGYFPRERVRSDNRYFDNVGRIKEALSGKYTGSAWPWVLVPFVIKHKMKLIKNMIIGEIE